MGILSDEPMKTLTVNPINRRSLYKPYKRACLVIATKLLVTCEKRLYAALL